MAKQEVDLSLIYTGSFISNDTKEAIIERLLQEASIKYEKYYTATNNREIKSSHGKYIDKQYKTTIYSFETGDSMYGFLIFLLNKKLKQIDQLNKSWY